MNDDEWTYQDEDFDPDSTYIELQFGIDDVYLIYKSLQVHLEKWPGGHPAEQDRGGNLGAGDRRPLGALPGGGHAGRGHPAGIAGGQQGPGCLSPPPSVRLPVWIHPDTEPGHLEPTDVTRC